MREANDGLRYAADVLTLKFFSNIVFLISKYGVEFHFSYLVITRLSSNNQLF